MFTQELICPNLSQVQAVLRRYWNQYRIQFGSTITHSDAMRSASYTASSITEEQGCYSIDGHSEHLNGKNCHDINNFLKPENPFAWCHWTRQRAIKKKLLISDSCHMADLDPLPIIYSVLWRVKESDTFLLVFTLKNILLPLSNVIKRTDAIGLIFVPHGIFVCFTSVCGRNTCKYFPIFLI